MLYRLRSHLAYWFAVVVIVGLMLLEHHVSNNMMIVLLCVAGIGHVWLTRRAMRELVSVERRNAVRSTVDFLRQIDHRMSDPTHSPFE